MPRRTAIRFSWLAANAINATLYDKLNFNFIRDIAPVASIMRAPHVLVVNPSVPAKTVPEFIAYAKANPGKINMASGWYRDTTHLCGELFKIDDGRRHCSRALSRAVPALTDLIGGQVQVTFATSRSRSSTSGPASCARSR